MGKRSVAGHSVFSCRTDGMDRRSVAVEGALRFTDDDTFEATPGVLQRGQ